MQIQKLLEESERLAERLAHLTRSAPDSRSRDALRVAEALAHSLLDELARAEEASAPGTHRLRSTRQALQCIAGAPSAAARSMP